MIVRRVKAGLTARKARGLRLGRIPLPMKTVNHACRLRQEGLSYAAIGKRLKISKGAARSTPASRRLRKSERISFFITSDMKTRGAQHRSWSRNDPDAWSEVYLGSETQVG